MLRVVLFWEDCGDGISVARAAPVCDCLKILKGHDRYAVDCGDNCPDRDFCKCCGRIGADQRDMNAVWRSGGLAGCFEKSERSVRKRRKSVVYREGRAVLMPAARQRNNRRDAAHRPFAYAAPRGRKAAAACRLPAKRRNDRCIQGLRYGTSA